MSLLVVGSVALDTVQTPAGRVEDALGGSATYFSAAASLFAPVQLVGVVGDDFPVGELDFLRERDVDLRGLVRASGESFRWSGLYSADLNSRETLETRLGVFADFEPRIPEPFGEADWVFLGNIDPQLQIDVLAQIRQPRLVAADTMNFWISGRRDVLLELLGKIDLLLVNDDEARELSREWNLARAARWIQDRGPRYVIIKKGEHGALLWTPSGPFATPGYPIEDVCDPTGAGDSFAGGFMGYLARAGSAEDGDLRRAMVYGCALGSYTVERFGMSRLKDLGADEIEDRVRAFRDLVWFDAGVGVNAGI